MEGRGLGWPIAVQSSSTGRARQSLSGCRTLDGVAIGWPNPLAEPTRAWSSHYALLHLPTGENGPPMLYGINKFEISSSNIVNSLLLTSSALTAAQSEEVRTVTIFQHIAAFEHFYLRLFRGPARAILPWATIAPTLINVPAESTWPRSPARNAAFHRHDRRIFSSTSVPCHSPMEIDSPWLSPIYCLAPCRDHCVVRNQDASAGQGGSCNWGVP